VTGFLARLGALKGNMKDAEFARKTGVPASTLKQYEKGSLPSIVIAGQIADAFEVSLDWLCGRSDERQRERSTQLHEIGNAAGDFIALPFFDVEASAGHGAVVAIHEDVRSVVSFERAFLRNLGAVPDHCKIIGARGDSMTPTIPDGALIVVDHSQREVVHGWISVVNVCGDLLVKRIRRRLDGTVELVSDNAMYPVETIGPDRIDQLTIIGRVVYFCRAP